MTMGEVPRTLEDVAKYLIKEYKMEPLKAIELVKRRFAIFEFGVSLGSYTYYIGDEMLRAEQMGLSDSVECAG